MRSESEGASADIFATDEISRWHIWAGGFDLDALMGLVASLRSRGGEAGLHCKDRFWLTRLAAGSLLYER